jgi:hypothetical protein
LLPISENISDIFEQHKVQISQLSGSLHLQYTVSNDVKENQENWVELVNSEIK